MDADDDQPVELSFARGLPLTRAAIAFARSHHAVRRRRYQKSLAMLERAIPGSRVVELLRFELEALDRLPPQPTEA